MKTKKPSNGRVIGFLAMKNKQTVELFSGTASFSKVAKSRKYKIATYDNCVEPDEGARGCHTVCDILDKSVVYPKRPFILWASPPCGTFSVASIGRNWDSITRKPKTENAEIGLKMLERTLEIIATIEPTWWFVENPRGMMRTTIKPLIAKAASGRKSLFFPYTRKTVTYCQYGDTRMKPTDIWTNCIAWKHRPVCRFGDPCHEPAPRGATETGTESLKNKKEKSRIPEELMIEILDNIERINNATE